MPHLATIQEICAALEEQGYPELARRITYFASDEDLEEGDAPVTLESALGFWEFFQAVDSVGDLDRLDMACSPEGCLSAYWDFPDKRRAAIWFPERELVRFAATDAGGKWVDIDGGGDTGGRWEVGKKLVEAGLFEWSPESPNGESLRPNTTLPGTAGVAT